ncbi:hypothetical protein ACRPK8_15665 [Exiguobacterium sp. TDN 0502]|uniref:hypothetical protein n=1 Tax=Exiguobacterium sp. TDN 0502 TaxID=3420731 RepID=UPI003D783CD1
MIKKQKFSGDEHTREVAMYLEQLIQEKSSLSEKQYPAIVVAQFLFTQFPKISEVKTKFDFERADHHADLYIYQDELIYPIHLFSLKKNATIQPKNPGAKSFLHKYFSLTEAQHTFNTLLDKARSNLFKDIAIHQGITDLYVSEVALKKSINALQLDESILKDYRKRFLEGIRDHCYSLLLDSLNEHQSDFFKGFKHLSMIEEYKVVFIEETYEIKLEQQTIQTFESVHLLKKNNSSIHILLDDYELELRFKFESSLTSSIKLATKLSHTCELTNQFQQKTRQLNTKWLSSFEDSLHTHTLLTHSNKSNAIGRCHEVLTLYQFIKHNPTIHLVDPTQVHHTLTAYYSYLESDVLQQLIESAHVTNSVLLRYLKDMYGQYQIEQIQLVSDSYIANKLETADILLTLRYEQNLIELPLSLKALKVHNSVMTIKNPGAGTILSYQYFDVFDEMQEFIARIKEKYLIGSISRQEVLSEVSNEITKHLSIASQHALVSGLKKMIGTNLSIVSFYQNSTCSIHPPIEVGGQIHVSQHSPTTTRLTWSDGNEYLNFRVKFSAGASRGWSSLKLSCERSVS